MTERLDSYDPKVVIKQKFQETCLENGSFSFFVKNTKSTTWRYLGNLYGGFLSHRDPPSYHPILDSDHEINHPAIKGIP